MNKKQSNSTAIIAAVGLFLAAIVGCILIVVDSSPKGSSTVTPEYLPLQIQGWESEKIETMCLEINQTYPEEWFGFFKETLTKLGINLTPRQFEFPYWDILAEVMKQIDIDVTGPDRCDAVLKLSVTGTAVSKRYGNIVTKRGDSVCYAGSNVNGALTLSADNHEEYNVFIRGNVSTPDFIYSSNCPDQPYDAPFDESSAEALTDGLVQFWGSEIAEIIRSLYRSGYGSEEAMFNAADALLKGETTAYPTVPAAEPATIETAEPNP